MLLGQEGEMLLYHICTSDGNEAASTPVVLQHPSTIAQRWTVRVDRGLLACLVAAAGGRANPPGLGDVVSHLSCPLPDAT